MRSKAPPGPLESSRKTGADLADRSRPSETALDLTPRRFPVFYRKVIVEMIECFVLTMFVMEIEGEFSP
jgi:hypothetical protein